MATRFVDATATFVTGLTEADAYNTFGAALTASSASDVIRMRNTHTEAPTTTQTYTPPATPGLQVLSVTFNGAGTGALTAGASILPVTNAVTINLDAGFLYMYGVTIAGATGISASNDIILGASANPTGMVFDNCTFSVPGTNTTAQLSIGSNAATGNDDNYYTFTNCTFSQGSNKSIFVRWGNIYIDNLTLAGTAPTTVFSLTAATASNVVITASDLSAVAWTNLVNVAFATIGSFVVKNCKLRSGFTLTTGAFTGPGGPVVTVIDSNSGDVNYYFARVNYQGTSLVSNSVYYDATNGSDFFSLLMTSSANTNFYSPLVSPDIVYFNNSLTAMTTTVECTNDGTTFKDSELWQETMAKITSGVPLGTWNRADRAADILNTGTNQTTSTVSWVGTGGFGAEVKQKLVSGSFTPAEIGPVTTIVKLAKASASVYVSVRIVPNSSKQWFSLASFINEAAAVNLCRATVG